MTEAVEAADPFVHPALFYGDTREYLAGTVPFVRAVPVAGEPVAVAVPGENLASSGTSWAPTATPYGSWTCGGSRTQPGRIIPGVPRAFADVQPPGRRVHIIGEPV